MVVALLSGYMIYICTIKVFLLCALINPSILHIYIYARKLK